jgi:hypothetical protein
MISSGKNIRCLFTFKCLSICREEGQNYEVIINKFNYSFLCKISTSTDSCYIKFIRSNLRVLHHCHVVTLHVKHISHRVFRYVYGLFTYKILPKWFINHCPLNRKLHIEFTWLPYCYFITTKDSLACVMFCEALLHCNIS